MNQNFKFSTSVILGLAFALTLQMSSTLLGQQTIRRTPGGVTVARQPEVRDHRRPTGTVPPPVVNPGGGQVGGYAGVFRGATRIEVLQPGTTTLAGGRWHNAGEFNLTNSMEGAWTVIRAMIKSEMTFFFKKEARDHRNRETMESIAGRKLYDLKITMADSSRATMFLTVPDDGRSITLQYRVPGNKMQFRAEVDNFFDPTISIETTITFKITLQPTGNAQNPLRVSAASVSLSDTKASVDGNVIFSAVKKIVEFAKGSDFERRIENLVNGKSKDITNQAERAIGFINNRLAPHAQTGASAIRFAYHRENGMLVIRMSNPRPVLASN